MSDVGVTPHIPRAMQRKYAADQSRRSRGWVRMAALVYCFRMPGNSAVAGSGSGWSLPCLVT